MTQLAIPDELAERIHSAAESCGRTSTELLDKIFNDILESDDEFASRMLTPVAQTRILEGHQQFLRGESVTQEQVDQKFERFFQDMRSR